MVVERFGDLAGVYRRFRDEGRGLPPGLTYRDSWVTPDLERRYQVMETADRSLLGGSTNLTREGQCLVCP